MVLIAKKGESYSFIIPDEQAERLGLAKGKQYELVKVKNGFFVLYEGTVKKTPLELDKKIFSLLREKKLSDRVEGKFEEFLTSEERTRLRELIQEGRIIPFKLSDQYRKAVYKTREEIEKAKPQAIKPKKTKTPTEPEKGPLKPIVMPTAKAKPLTETEKPEQKESYSLDRDEFTVVSSEEEAKQLSRKLNEEIRKREVLGTKSFDGNYFVIKTSLYEKHSPAVLKLIKDNSPITADELSHTLRLNKQLVKAICEFLREEGEITERRKEIYEYIP